MFQHGKANIRTKAGKLVLQCKKKFRLYWLNNVCAVVVGNRANAGIAEEVDPNSWASWHRRYGHISNSTLELLVKNQSVEGLTVDPESRLEDEDCESCIQAKMHRRPFPRKALHRSKEPGEGIHSDLWGPARTRSTEGNYYYISFTDDASRRKTVLFMRTKDEAKFKVMEHIEWLEWQRGYKPKWIRVDEGTEYVKAVQGLGYRQISRRRRPINRPINRPKTSAEPIE